MQAMTLTTLRKDIFRVIDDILVTGKPLEIERKGRRLMIMPLDDDRPRLSRLIRRELIQGDPDTLVDEKVGEWSEERILMST